MKQTPKSTVIANKKKELFDKSDQLRSEMTNDLHKLKVDVGRIGKNFLIIGGSLYVAYKISKLFTRSSSSEEKVSHQLVETRESSAMATKIKEQIALFLLALAFNKLKEFLKEHIGEDEQKDT
jgi:hypothetical protein